MYHRYRQILFYSVIVFLFVLICSLWSDARRAEENIIKQSPVEQPYSGALTENVIDDEDDFMDDMISEYHTEDDIEDSTGEYEEIEENQELSDDDALTPVRLDTKGPSHRFWPDDENCSQLR